MKAMKGEMTSNMWWIVLLILFIFIVFVFFLAFSFGSGDGGFFTNIAKGFGGIFGLG